MPAKDVIHDAVKRALVHDGWTITHDPFILENDDVKLFADLGAERPFAAERESERIVVEVKSFLGASPVRDLEVALGQYQLYRTLMSLLAPEYGLFIAVPEEVFSGFFSRETIRLVLADMNVNLVVVDIEKETVMKWTS